MGRDEIIEMAIQAGFEKVIYINPNTNIRTVQTYGSNSLEDFAKLVAAQEREAIAQMFDHAPALVEFARNDQGGCIMCGFTPELAIASIRARGEA